MSMQFNRDGHTLRAERDFIEVMSFSPRPDPNWQYTDQQGHEHHATSGLLIRMLDDPDGPEFYFDADGDEHNAPDHMECRLCGEWIEPGSLPPSPFPEHIPGPVRYYIDDQHVSEAEAEAFMQANQ